MRRNMGPQQAITPEEKLRSLNRRFDEIEILRGSRGNFIIEARKKLTGDSRLYAPWAWAPTVAEAIDILWRKA